MAVPPKYGRGGAPHQCLLEVALYVMEWVLMCAIPMTHNNEGRATHG